MKGRTIGPLVLAVATFLSLAAATSVDSAAGELIQTAENLLGSTSLENYQRLWAHRDNNLNKIDDVIEHILENRDLFNIRKVSYALSGKRDDIRGSFILNFDRAVKSEDLTELAKRVSSSSIHKFGRINAVSIRDVDFRLVENFLSKMEGVEVVELQHKVRSLLNVSSSAVKAKPSTNYASVWEDLGVDGTGVNIAILDTGVDDEHESFTGKYVAGVDTTGPADLEFNPNDQSDYDTFHGTHAAGIAMGTGGVAQTYRGVAPGAGLIDVRVLDSKGEGTSESVIRGIEWVIANKDIYNIKVMSMSLGSDSNSNGTDAQSQAVNQAVQAGIVVVVAAGNDGEEGFINSPGAADGAITVGALFDHGSVNRGDDTVASYSNQGPRLDDGDSDPYDELKPDITAPGSFIVSAKGSNGTASNDYHSLSGTSMATPHVAGIVALMLEANQNLTPAEVREILHETAEAKGIPYDPSLSDKYNTSFGWGMVDAYAAVQRAMGLAGNPDFYISSGDIAFSDNTPVEGQRILVTATVGNQGNVDGTCDVAYYAKTGGVFSPVGKVKGLFVKAGGNAQAKLARTASAQGDYEIKVVLENARPVETNTSNNEATTSINVGAAPMAPDLTLMEYDIFFRGKLAASLLENVRLGSLTVQDIRLTLLSEPITVGISARIHNVGQTDATSDVKFYIDQKIPDNLIASFDSVFVSSKDENLLTTTWDLPEDLQGDHEVWVVIDKVSPTDDDPNNNEASRTRSLPTKMTVGDIAVSTDDISFSDNSPVGGQTISINVTVHNTGVIDVDNVKVALYVDNQATTVGEIEFIEQNSENTVGIDWVAVEGDHEIGVSISLQGVQESSGTNNTALASISVSPGLPIALVLPVAAVLAVIAVIILIKRK